MRASFVGLVLVLVLALVGTPSVVAAPGPAASPSSAPATDRVPTAVSLPFGDLGICTPAWGTPLLPFCI